MLSNRRYIFFVLIILLAALIRFYALNTFPVSLYWDEVAQGYNAYSIAMTGRDEFGSAHPLLFRSFDDNKMPVYIYLTAIVTKLLGLNEFSTRFLSATAGTLTVVFTMLLTKEILEKGNYKNSEHIFLIGNFSGLMLAISPWHINFSRGAFEANLALFFVVLGFYIFLKGLQKNVYLYISVIPFLFAFYTYRSILIFLPVLIIGSILIFNQYFRKNKLKHLILLLLMLSIFVMPLLKAVFSDFGDKRASQVSIFVNSSQLLYENSIQQVKEGNTILARIKYNRRIMYVRIALQNYMSHFSPSFLFFNGDGNGRHSIKGMGMMYVWELPLIFLGLIILYKNIKDKRYFWFLVLWVFAAPLPASLSVPAPHALRSLNMLPIPQMLVGIAIINMYYLIKGYRRIVFFTCIVLLFTVSLSIFIYKYRMHVIKAGSEWGDGYKQLVQEVKKKHYEYDKIIVTGENWEPYIYFLYYTHYNPAEYQKTGSSIGFDKYIFGGTSWDKDKKRKTLQEFDLQNMLNQSKSLLVLTPQEYKILKVEFNKVWEIKNHNNDRIYIIGEAI